LNEGDPAQAELALERLSGAIEAANPPEVPTLPAQSDPVTAADVIDMHRFLDGFDGDFIGYFRRSENV
jgi:hypothetical protein